MNSFHSEPRLQFLFSLLQIIAINLILSGDNAIVIALAAKTLPRKLRVLIVGSACAAVILISVTVFATELLRMRFLRLVASLVVLWISLNLWQDAAGNQHSEVRVPNFWKAVWFIIAADTLVHIYRI